MSDPDDTAPRRGGPVFLAPEDAATETPATAAPVPDSDASATGAAPVAAMQRFAMLMTSAQGRGARLGRWFGALLATLAGFGLGLWTWQVFLGLFAISPPLGWAVAAVALALLVVAIALAAREWAMVARLGRLDRVRAAVERAAAAGDLAEAHRVAAQVARLYSSRRELAPGLARLRARQSEILDADGLLQLVERELIASLDDVARREVENAARTIALVTALVPLALADVVTALLTNLRMIRRIATIYGGRSGVIGSFRLVRAVLAHLVATGAVAAGDDLIHSIAGGGLLSRLSRRFGEGVVNAALTARVGIATMEVCRPMPFLAARRPSTSRLLGRALSGLFDRGGAGEPEG